MLPDILMNDTPIGGIDHGVHEASTLRVKEQQS